jgi:drug/metabolite transporter (DMT)-like permease
VGAVPLFLVLASASLHASWNLVVKSSVDRLLAAWSQVAFGALVFAPVLVAAGVPRRVLPAIAASSLVHVVYGLVLVAAYERGAISLVYPVARGIAPVLVTAVAAVLLDDIPSAGGLVAIGFVVWGVTWVASGSNSRGLGWALATGSAIAAYTLIDGAAVRSLDTALPYTSAVFVGTAVLYTPVIALRRSSASVKRGFRTEWRRHLLAGTASAGAYALVLAAARLAPLGLVAAFRETSVLFGVIGGWLILREPDARARLRGASLIAVGLGVLVLVA